MVTGSLTASTLETFGAGYCIPVHNVPYYLWAPCIADLQLCSHDHEYCLGYDMANAGGLALRRNDGRIIIHFVRKQPTFVAISLLVGCSGFFYGHCCPMIDYQ